MSAICLAMCGGMSGRIAAILDIVVNEPMSLIRIRDVGNACVRALMFGSSEVCCMTRRGASRRFPISGGIGGSGSKGPRTMAALPISVGARCPVCISKSVSSSGRVVPVRTCVVGV